jgi:hypothetical protein
MRTQDMEDFGNYSSDEVAMNREVSRRTTYSRLLGSMKRPEHGKKTVESQVAYAAAVAQPRCGERQC